MAKQTVEVLNKIMIY